MLILDDSQRILLLEARLSDGLVFWLMPGGGLEPGETFEAAARREVQEETGLVIALGPCIWTRRHVFELEGRTHDQYERYFIATSIVERGTATNPDDYVLAARWWTLDELIATTVELTPRRLASLLPSILAGHRPSEPFDCGV